VLEVVPDYLLVTNRDRRLLFALAGRARADLCRIRAVECITAPPPGSAGAGNALLGRYRLNPNGPTLHYVVRSVPDAGGQFGAIFAAADTGSAELRLQELLTTLMIAFVVGVVARGARGRWIAGRALEPVDRMITEVREITTAASLHRRLAVPMERDELGRLAATLESDDDAPGAAASPPYGDSRPTASHELKTR